MNISTRCSLLFTLINMIKIAIVGAGLAGLTAATQLKDHAEITVFEKSRGLGGRLATRRASPYAFDHGAQFFKVHSPDFAEFIAPLLESGDIQRWDGIFAEIANRQIIHSRQWGAEYPHYVGTPQMNAVGKAIAARLPGNVIIQQPVRVAGMYQQSNGWHLTDDSNESLGTFDWVISAAPAEQASTLLPPSFLYFERVKNTQMQACFSLMLGFAEKSHLGFDAALVRDADISWVSVNHSKPGRPADYSLLIHSTNSWADEHLDDDRDAVKNHLLAQSAATLGINVSAANHIDLHSWRFANINMQSGLSSLMDTRNRLGVCGDWCIQGRVEAAFTSGNNLAHQIIAAINNQSS